jgi:asparagine synthase (glutamine-hydrolysing)
VNVGNSHIVPFLFDFLMTRCCVYLRSKLSKFLPDVLAEPARFYFWRFLRRLELPRCDATIPAKKADAREFQDCYCARIGLCWAPSSRMIDRISPTIRNEPVTRIQPRPRAKTAMAHRELAVQQRGRIRSFSVDFANYGAAFVASSDFHKASDTPFTRDFVAHVGCDHSEVVLDSRELADQDLRRAVIQAADFPLGTSGDMYSSLYRLFQAVRAESTVALSGESADEVFGGYSWFHDPKTVNAATFPWLAAATTASDFDGTQVLDADLLERLNLPEFQADSYAQAIAETPVQKGENAVERRMRDISYLHLTRFVQYLLDRKDRMSMAVGLEVRVPFCDHRLVDYVFNIPWHLKTFDGREKSILRVATRELLPNSIVERQKNPYPSTQDPGYEKALRAEVTEVLENRSHPATSLLNRKVIEDLLERPLGTTSLLPRACWPRACALD